MVTDLSPARAPQCSQLKDHTRTHLTATEQNRRGAGALIGSQNGTYSAEGTSGESPLGT